MRNPKRPGIRPSFPSGFALVASLSIMVLLVVIAVGLLSLSSITLRTSSTDQLALEARQNARLALMVAIGELQSATGPDQRVTAPAGILGANSAQPHITGVWEGWKWDGANNPDFDERKKSGFLRWLVSTSDPQDAQNVDFTRQNPPGELITLIRGNRDASFGDQVEAQIVSLPGFATQSRNGMAWAIFDQSTKLPISLPDAEAKSLSEELEGMAAAPLPGYNATTERDWKPLGQLAGQRKKLISTNQVELAGLDPADRGFHDLTPRTAGVIADVANGGLRVDLSRLFDDPGGLPSAYKDRHLYSGTNTPLAPPPNRFQGANPFPSPDPTWSLMRSHYRLFDQLTGGQAPTISTSTIGRPAPGVSGDSLLQHPYFRNQQIAPVIAKAQFVFSLSFGWHPTLPNFARPGNAALPNNNPNKDFYITWLVVDPVITLWNPYNVNLRFPAGRIDLYRVPLTFRLYKNGTLINSEYTHLANCFLENQFANRRNTFYRLNLLPKRNDREIVMAPGEHLVFTASNHVKTFNNEFSNMGLDLRPGFSPPAGNASNSQVGGVSTLNVCVSHTGASNGTDYGKTVRSIAVKPGDVIQVEVKQGRAAVDIPPETGGREVSGFMKYYVGDPSSPSLVGGIELDYGDQEPEFLPSYSVNDLPALVVSNQIPRWVKADDYQGQNPPPVVRFKEPFLISTFQLKTERDSKFPSRGWINNSPVNLYASAGLDQQEAWPHHQYELQWEVMTDWPPSSPTIEISNTNNRGYGGSGIYAQSGLEFATHSTIPTAPALSLAQLRHAPLNTGGQLPLTSQVVANSFAPPLIDSSAIRATSGERTLLDHSYLANAALFDGYFFSGIASPGGPLGRAVTPENAIRDFFDNGTPLANPRLIPYHRGKSPQQIAAELTATDGYLKSAAHLLIDSPLNVNSTRVDVWEAILNSTFGVQVPRLDGGVISSSIGDNTAFSRHLPGNGDSFENANGPLARDLAKWNGHRRLTPEQVRRLAEEIVVEVRERGPFQSVSEFVNRRPGNGALAQSGALQAAIERAGINSSTTNPANAVENGNTADGSPGILTQADILTAIAPTLTARGDTFIIRAYGEAGLSSSKVKVWCEAVVQRVPEYLDPADEPWLEPTLSANQRFGRRYEVVSFRWLSPEEI